MNKNRENISIIFNGLEHQTCLCQTCNAKAIWCQIYQNSFENNDYLGRNDDQLLCISFIRLTGEIFFTSVSKFQSVCSNIQQLVDVFLSEDLWTVFIHHLKHSEDKHLVYTFIKAFSLILYASSESTFSKRVEYLLNDVEGNIFIEKNINVLDFLSNLVGFKPPETHCEIYICNNAVSNVDFSFTDLFQSLCMLLSLHWDSFMKQFYETTTSKTENKSLNRFLLLWQKLISSHLKGDLYLVYFNEKYIIAFLSNSYNIDVISLRIYTDIIMQVVISNLKIKPSQRNCNSFKEAVAAALDNKFLNLLPSDIQLCGFCTSTSSKCNESLQNSLQKCDTVIVKKVSFIFLNIITDFEDKQFLSSAVLKVFNFIKHNLDISSDTPVYTWILDVFIDQDDILFGIMLALLRIYVILKKYDTFSFPESTLLQKSLNPHKIFIRFLQNIGFDHNELLSFLTSDETCFLLYILQYLKLLLKESDIFMEAHSNLINAGEDVHDCALRDSSREEESQKTNSLPPPKKNLVSYSSSSSEEDYPPPVRTESKTENVFLQNNFIVIKTLIKLKNAITKLVDAREFPYNILPLVLLLQTCEKEFLLL